MIKASLKKLKQEIHKNLERKEPLKTNTKRLIGFKVYERQILLAHYIKRIFKEV